MEYYTNDDSDDRDIFEDEELKYIRGSTSTPETEDFSIDKVPKKSEFSEETDKNDQSQVVESKNYYLVSKSTIHWLVEHIKVLESDVKQLVEIKSDLSAIKRECFGTSDCNVDLPITDIEDFELQLAHRPEYKEQIKNYFKKFRPISNKGLRCPTGIEAIFSNSQLFRYNWTGSCGKKSFGKMKNINEVLYDAWLGNGELYTNFSKYITTIKLQFYTFKTKKNMQFYRAEIKQRRNCDK